jgi:hypothetical protein
MPTTANAGVTGPARRGRRAAPPRRAAAVPRGLTVSELFARLGLDAGRTAAAAWPGGDCPRPCGLWRDEARDPWA